jgi:hypothetical protein
MATSVLTREEITNDSYNDVMKEDILFAEAAYQLGYTPLQQSMQRRQANAILRAKLQLVGVSPFTVESVQRYKKIAIANTRKPKLRVFVGTAIIIAMIAATIGLVDCLSRPDTSDTITFGALFATAVGWLLSTIIAGAVIFNGRKAQWMTHSLHNFKEQVPEFAIQTAIDIREHCPDAEFYVDKLEFTRPLDLFLCVKTRHSDMFYVEVWNEPGFKQQREI